MKPCPLCGSDSAPKFSTDSDWCAPCAHDEIVLQKTLDHAPERPEVFER